MPKIMEILGYIISFWSNKGQPSEPVHVHISKKPNKNGTKVLLKSDGTVQLEHNKSQIPPKELRRLIICEWKKFFQVERVEYIDLPQKENTISRSR